ncbi:MAG: hypothetical protein WA975_15925 [Mesorhizobium sp.]
MQELERAAAQRPDVAGLREIRKLLYSAEFSLQLAEHLDRHHNRPPEALAELRERLQLIGAAFRDLEADRKSYRAAVRAFAMGGGATVSAGAVVAALTTAIFPPAGIAVFTVGAVCAGKGYLEDRNLAAELSALHDIVATVDKLIERMDNKGLR